MAGEQSPLVQAIMTLDSHFTELDRVGERILEMDLKSDFDFVQAQKLMTRFAEYGEGVSKELTGFLQHLNAARVQAEKVAAGVAAKADILNSRREDRERKIETFRALGEKVRDLSESLVSYQRPPGQSLSEIERTELKTRLNEFELRLSALIDEARTLREGAHEARMRSLEQNADSLSQTLVSIQEKIKTMDMPT